MTFFNIVIVKVTFTMTITELVIHITHYDYDFQSHG